LFWAGDCSLVFFLCSSSAIKRKDVYLLNGAPHAITAGCYSADLSPSPIKTRVKATSRGGRQERQTEDCREKNRGAARKSQENKGGPEEKLVKNR